MAEELKGCPFCGGEAFIDERQNPAFGQYFVPMCYECEMGHANLGFLKKKDAVKAWNRRTSDEQ